MCVGGIGGAAVAAGWQEQRDPTGRPYYVNLATQQVALLARRTLMPAGSTETAPYGPDLALKRGRLRPQKGSVA